MSEQKGIKETSEVMIAALRIAGVVVPHLKDGFQAGKDLPAIFMEFASNQSLQDALKEASKGIDQVGAEMADVTLPEGLQLLGIVYPELLALLDKLSKK